MVKAEKDVGRNEEEIGAEMIEKSGSVEGGGYTAKQPVACHGEGKIEQECLQVFVNNRRFFAFNFEAVVNILQSVGHGHYPELKTVGLEEGLQPEPERKDWYYKRCGWQFAGFLTYRH